MSDALCYRELAVPPRLSGHVRCLWRMSGDARSGPPEAVIPDGCGELIVNLGDPFIHHTSAGSHRQPSTLLAGQITQAITVGPSGRVDLWGVRFHPWGAAPALGFSGVEMQNCLTSLADVAPRLERTLARVGDAVSEQRQLEMLIDVLGRHVDGARPTDHRVSRLMAIVAEHRHPFTVRGLARHVGLSTRRVQLLFRDDVGLSPILAHRISRFQRALALRRVQPRLTWSAIAMRAGYYDQAHLLHDARDIAGQTPNDLLGEGALTQAFLSR